VAVKPARGPRSPFVKCLELIDLPAIELPAGALVFVVGPNNGGKSTFLTEIVAQLSRAAELKWIRKVDWDVGSEAEFQGFVEKHFKPHIDERYLIDVTGNFVPKVEINNFAVHHKTSNPSFLVRLLDAQNRIGLSNATAAPDVIKRNQLHPYHAFFYSNDGELEFSKKIKAAFGKDFRINRTGQQVSGYLGKAPTGDRLSVDYERSVISEMEPVQNFGDGVKSYTGILLNAVADPRPVTIVDEPEAFLHPPQARRLGQEIALAAKSGSQQAFIATHSADFIQGALGAKHPNMFFLYLDHSNKERPLHAVDRAVVEEFSRKPFLAHTNALDALFYSQAVVCEGEADIMFFKWVLERGPLARKLEESFWVSSYGKAAIPSILEDMRKLGVDCKCVFDLDVLLSPEILRKICGIIGIEFEPYSSLLAALAHAIRVPPAAEALEAIVAKVRDLPDDIDDGGRAQAIREIKRSAESLGKSWVLKSSGLAAIPKGDLHRQAVEFLDLLRGRGVLILEEGEIENYVPAVGGHGQSWVRSALEAGQISAAASATLTRQFKSIL